MEGPEGDKLRKGGDHDHVRHNVSHRRDFASGSGGGAGRQPGLGPGGGAGGAHRGGRADRHRSAPGQPPRGGGQAGVGDHQRRARRRRPQPPPGPEPGRGARPRARRDGLPGRGRRPLCRRAWPQPGIRQPDHRRGGGVLGLADLGPQPARRQSGGRAFHLRAAGGGSEGDDAGPGRRRHRRHGQSRHPQRARRAPVVLGGPGGGPVRRGRARLRDGAVGEGLPFLRPRLRRRRPGRGAGRQLPLGGARQPQAGRLVRRRGRRRTARGGRRLFLRARGDQLWPRRKAGVPAHG